MGGLILGVNNLYMLSCFLKQFALVGKGLTPCTYAHTQLFVQLVHMWYVSGLWSLWQNHVKGIIIYSAVKANLCINCMHMQWLSWLQGLRLCYISNYWRPRNLHHDIGWWWCSCSIGLQKYYRMYVENLIQINSWLSYVLWPLIARQGGILVRWLTIFLGHALGGAELQIHF